MTTHPLELRLFAVARAAVIGAALLAFLGAGGVALELLMVPSAATAVTFEDVEHARAPKAAPVPTATDAPWPPRVVAFAGDDPASLWEALDLLPEDERAAFIADLDTFLAAANKDPALLEERFGVWFDLKLARVEAAQAAAPGEQLRRSALISTALGFGALGVLLSMALVLLAIERNTRPRAFATPADPLAGEDDVLLAPEKVGHRVLR